MPVATPMRAPLSLAEASGFPKRKSKRDIRLRTEFSRVVPASYAGESGRMELNVKLDALRVDEAAAARGEGARQESVLCDRLAQAREVGERRVCGKREDQQDGANRQVIEKTFAGNGAHQHRQDALISRCARIGGGDAVGRTSQAMPPSITMRSAMMTVII